MDSPDQSFGASLVEGGILLGAMNRLMSSNAGFKFSVREDPNFGPFLESVNGLAGSDQEQTYWELLVTTATDETIRPEVGIGCYVPKAHDKIILNYQSGENSAVYGKDTCDVVIKAVHLCLCSLCLFVKKKKKKNI
uniref:DUF4430 domain-containing protein n=1 Tax=Neogobius melanostomus TaxID=47308 RepID=A0A8C6WF60_9GOBI